MILIEAWAGAPTCLTAYAQGFLGKCPVLEGSDRTQRAETQYCFELFADFQSTNRARLRRTVPRINRDPGSGAFLRLRANAKRSLKSVETLRVRCCPRGEANTVEACKNIASKAIQEIKYFFIGHQDRELQFSNVIRHTQRFIARCDFSHYAILNAGRMPNQYLFRVSALGAITFWQVQVIAHIMSHSGNSLPHFCRLSWTERIQNLTGRRGSLEPTGGCRWAWTSRSRRASFLRWRVRDEKA